MRNVFIRGTLRPRTHAASRGPSMVWACPPVSSRPKMRINALLRLKTFLILCSLCTAFTLQGAVFTSELITNLPPAEGVTLSSFPSNGVTMGGFIYFAAADGPYGGSGRELWR